MAAEVQHLPGWAGCLCIDCLADVHRIGSVESISSVTTKCGSSQSSGCVEGLASEGRFADPGAVVVDTAGNILICDRSNHRICVISPAGVVSTLAGTGTTGGGSEALFHSAGRIASDTGNRPDEPGVIYVCDTANHAIRRVKDGQSTTLAGGSGEGFRDAAAGDQALFRSPTGI